MITNTENHSEISEILSILVFCFAYRLSRTERRRRRRSGGEVYRDIPLYTSSYPCAILTLQRRYRHLPTNQSSPLLLLKQRGDVPPRRPSNGTETKVPSARQQTLAPRHALSFPSTNKYKNNINPPTGR